jgi:medium-chain acyl-[acyl-carrier-protein] hydrolase
VGELAEDGGSDGIWRSSYVFAKRINSNYNKLDKASKVIQGVAQVHNEAVKIKEGKFTVKTYECQADGNIRIVSLMQYLQEVAALHAEQLGFGFGRLNEIHSYWVLSNLRIEIARLPKWNEVIAIKTWPSGYTRLIATREFVGKDQYDCELFRAGSEWMVLDKQKNRPKNLFRLDLGLPKTGPKAISGELNRLEPQCSYSDIEQVRVPYSAIDLNGHVNNTEYVRWGIDALRKKFEFKGNIRFLQVTYLSEVFEGDELEVLVSSGRNERFYVLGRKTGGGGNVYLMQISC